MPQNGLRGAESAHLCCPMMFVGPRIVLEVWNPLEYDATRLAKVSVGTRIARQARYLLQSSAM